MKVYKRSDRIPVVIKDVTFKIAPLSFDQKNEVAAMMAQGQRDQSVSTMQKASTLAMKYSIRSVEGLEDSDGGQYKIQFDDQGNVSDESIDDLFNLEITNELVIICAGLVNGIPSEKIRGVATAESKSSITGKNE